MAKIAREAHTLAAGHGWTVRDVVCSLGPQDRPFDEQHDLVTIAIVVSGTFQYRGSGCNGRETMTPGSVLLGSSGQGLECGHEHGTGDRCLSFHYTPEYFGELADGFHARGATGAFRSLRLPPVRALSPLVAEICSALAGSSEQAWLELGIRLAAQAVHADADLTSDDRAVSAAAIRRVTRTVRLIERHPAADLSVIHLAREAGLSLFHYVRTFQSVAGVTPHQYVLRSRLRAAASRLATASVRIVDVALDAGFGDVSNFNHAFRREFGVSPTAYRSQRLR